MSGSQQLGAGDNTLRHSYHAFAAGGHDSGVGFPVVQQSLPFLAVRQHLGPAQTFPLAVSRFAQLVGNDNIETEPLRDRLCRVACPATRAAVHGRDRQHRQRLRQALRLLASASGQRVVAVADVAQLAVGRRFAVAYENKSSCLRHTPFDAITIR